jgi:hypothetical protein
VATLRSWVRGRSYQTERGKAKSGVLGKAQEEQLFKRQFSQPLIELQSPEAKELSFTSLVEAHVLRAIRVEHRIPTDRIRTALDYINSMLLFSDRISIQPLQSVVPMITAPKLTRKRAACFPPE